MKKWNMKKILTITGMAGIVIAPISAVVACSNPSPSEGNKKPNEHINGVDGNVKPGDGDGTKPSSQKLLANGDKNPFEDVKEDGLYLWSDTYNGKLWDGDTIKDGREISGITEIGEQSGWDLAPSVQLGKANQADEEDSIYMVYDKDDNDGMNMDNFTDTVFFEDTSVAMVDEMYKINEEVFGNKTVSSSIGKAEYVAFRDSGKNDYSGQINTYVGSQNNHVSAGASLTTGSDFSTKMLAFINEYKAKQPGVVTKLLKYYGLKMEGDKMVDDLTITNHANRGFAPVFYTQPIFTYEKVFDNVLKITYHDRPGFQATAAHFRFAQPDGSYKSIGSWSIGKGDWYSYWGHPEAKYVGLKK